MAHTAQTTTRDEFVDMFAEHYLDLSFTETAKLFDLYFPDPNCYDPGPCSDGCYCPDCAEITAADEYQDFLWFGHLAGGIAA
jgi:hypothetical protein